MKKYLDKFQSPFLRWWMMFVLICLGGVASWHFGLLREIADSDFTRISFFIYALFMFYSIFTGHNTKQAAGQKAERKLIERRNESAWFVSDILTGLGMIGTVAGFIYMLGNSFTQLSVGDASSMMAALKQMGAGMATALYTTGVGLVCSILLKIQVFNLDQHLNFGWGETND
jgi:hypothetical protein